MNLEEMGVFRRLVSWFIEKEVKESTDRDFLTDGLVQQ